MVDARERRLEIFATLVLALAGLGAAFAGYQASLWDGEQSQHYGEGASLRLQSSEARSEADDDRISDLTVFENYVDATIAGDEEEAAFYQDRFRDEFVPAYRAWIVLDPFNNRDTPSSPMLMDEYHLSAADESTLLGDLGAVRAPARSADTARPVGTRLRGRRPPDLQPAADVVSR